MESSLTIKKQQRNVKYKNMQHLRTIKITSCLWVDAEISEERITEDIVCDVTTTMLSYRSAA